MKNLIHIITAIALLLALMAGCTVSGPAVSSSPQSDTTSDVTQSPQPSEEVTPAPETTPFSAPLSDALGEIDAGGVDGTTFVNNWAGLKLTLPDGAYFADADTMSLALGESPNYAVNGAEIASTAVMLYDFIAYLEDGASYMLLRYENLAATADPRLTADSYIDRISELLKDSGFAAEETGHRQLAGERWSYARYSELSDDDETLSAQSYYVRRNGAAIMVLITTEMNGYEGMDGVIASITTP